MDNLTQITTYTLTLFLAALLPGPGMTGLMFKTLAQGYKQGLTMLLGLITGDMIFLLSSIFLISSLTQLAPNFVFYLIVFSSIYLLYLAYNFWIFKGDLLQLDQPTNLKDNLLSYKEGLMITLTNPKTISFYLAIVPAIFGVMSAKQQGMVLVPVTILILVIVGGLYIFCSWYVKKVLRSLVIQKFLLKSLSLMMCALALGMLYRELSSHLYI